MAPAGLAAIDKAKANGSWEVYDTVERLEVPEDLAAALERTSRRRLTTSRRFPRPRARCSSPGSRSPNDRETRATRIGTVAEAAARNERARS